MKIFFSASHVLMTISTDETISETVVAGQRDPRDLILPLIMLAVAIIGGIFLMKMLKKSEKAQTPGQGARSETVTAQEFINVKDIKDNFLYTNTNEAIAYIRIQGVAIELFSNSEKLELQKRLTADLSAINFPFKFMALSRPVDISPLLTNMQLLLESATNQKQKELLRKEIGYMSAIALNAEMVERQFFISVWDDINECDDILKRAKLLIEKFNNNNIRAELLKEKEIVQLINLAHNPSYIHIEDSDISANIPFLEELS